jgi:abhydrolase domain-containing protein 17
MELKNLIITILVGYFLLTTFAMLFADKLIFLPPRPSYHDSDEIIKIKVNDRASIAAVYIPNSKAKYTLLISHGNAEDIGYMSPFLQQLHGHEFSILAYDYEGYGQSSGSATEPHVYQDVAAVYDYAVNTLHIPANRIILYGTSIGAAVSIELSSKKPVAAVIAQSPFLSAYRIVTHFPILLFDKFENIKKITQINCPILIIHGTADTVVPFWHGKKLFELAKPPKYNFWVPDANHNDLIYIASESYWKALNDFIANLANEIA